MSIKLMSWVWENATQKGSELLLLLAMADSANDTGHCWPSIDTMSRKTRLGKRYIIDLLEKLEKSGNISREKRWDKKGDPTSNMYQVLTPYMGVVNPSAPPVEGEVVNQGSLPSEPQCTTLVNPSAPYPLFNRQLSKDNNKENLEFEKMKNLVEKMIGYPSTQKDTIAIDEFVKIGVIDNDISAALTFYKDNNKAAYGASQILKSVKFNVAKRTQTSFYKSKQEGVYPELKIL